MPFLRRQSTARSGDAAAARDRFRAGVAELLGAALDPRATLDEVAGLAVPSLAELCVVDLLDADGRPDGTGIATAADRRAAERISTVRTDTPIDPDGPHPVARAVRTGTVQFIPRTSPDVLREIAVSDAHHASMVELGYSSLVSVPLIARGRTLGTLTLVHLGGAVYSPADVDAVVEVAGRAAQALDNARLFAELRAAEAQQEAILGAMSQVVTVQDRDGRIVFANQAATQSSGVSASDLMALTLDRFKQRYDVTDEHGVELPLSAFPAAAVLAGRDPDPLLVRILDRETGDVRWLQMNGRPVHDEHGEVVLAVSVGDDVTAVKQAETVQRFLASASKLLSSSLDVDTTLARAAATVVPALADWCRVDIVDEQGRLVPSAFAHPDDAPAEHVALARMIPRLDPSDPRSAWHVLHHGEPVLIADVARDASPVGDPEQIALAQRLGLRSVAVVPMYAGEKIVGLLTLATARSQRMLRAFEIDLAAELGRRAGMAVEHARVHAASRHIAETLQRSLLPRQLPQIPGVTLAARFRAAGEGTSVGGDFYDAFPGCGGWVVVMGDVAGKGPEAAATTAQARDTLRTAAFYEPGPAAILRRLNATLAEEDPAPLCTAIAVLVLPRPDGSGVRITVSCAGHPRPHLVSAGGGSRLVGEYGTLLGAFDGGTWQEVTLDLDDGDALVLYTDGVTDARGPADRFGQPRLSALLAEAGGHSAEELAALVDGAVAAFEDGPQHDDLAVLVLHVGEAPAAVGTAAEPAPDGESRRMREVRTPRA